MGGDTNNKDSNVGNQFNNNKIDNLYLGTNPNEKNYSILPCRLYNTKLTLKEEVGNFNKYCISWKKQRILILGSLHQQLQNLITNKFIQAINIDDKYALKRLLPKKEEDDKLFDIQLIVNSDEELNNSIILLTLESGRNAKIFLNELFTNNESLSEMLKSRNILLLCQVDSDANDLYSYFKNEIKNGSEDDYHLPYLRIYLLSHLKTILSRYYGEKEKLDELSEKIIEAWKNEKFSRDEQELYRFLFQDLTINNTYRFEQKLENISDDKISPNTILENVNNQAEQLICLIIFYALTSFSKLTFREFKVVVEFLLKKYGEVEINISEGFRSRASNGSMESLMIELVHFISHSKNESNIESTEEATNKITTSVNLSKIWKTKADSLLNQCFIGVFREDDSGKEFIQFTLPYLKEDIRAYLFSKCRTLVDRNTKTIVFNKFLFTEKFSDTFIDAVIQIIIDRLKADKHYWGTYPITRLILPLVDNNTIHEKYGLPELNEEIIEDLDITKDVATHAFVSLFKDKHLKPFFNLLFGLLNDKETQSYAKDLFNILINEGLGVIVLELLKFKGYPPHFDKVFWIKQIIHRGGVIKDLKDFVNSLELQINAHNYLKFLPVENVSNIYEVLERIRSEWWNSNDGSQLELDEGDIVIKDKEQTTNTESSKDEALENNDSETVKSESAKEEELKDDDNEEKVVELKQTEDEELKEGKEEVDSVTNEEIKDDDTIEENKGSTKGAEKPITNEKQLKLPTFLYDFSHSILYPLPDDLYGIYPPVYYLFTSFTNDKSKLSERFDFLIEWLFHAHLDTITYNNKISSNDFLWGITTEKPEKNLDKIIYQDKKHGFYMLQNDQKVKPQNADIIEGW